MKKRMKKRNIIRFDRRIKMPNGYWRTFRRRVLPSDVIQKEYLELVAHSAKHIITSGDSHESMTDIEKMNLLLDTLREVEIEENIKESTRANAEYPCYIKWPDENLRNEMDALCCDLFIDNNGDPNMANIHIFNDVLQSDYYVGPGERDRFGWLSGAIATPDDSLLMLTFG